MTFYMFYSFRFTAMATDNKYNVTTDITIKVLEVNDNPPIFQQQIYRETISEGQRGKDLEYILTVKATDADSATSSAGVINYEIGVGSQGKFKLNGTTGVLTTAEFANFDYETQRVYNMTIVARDEGIPSQSGTAYVIINIRNENNKNPFIKPETRRADVYENVIIGTSVLQVIGEDPDGGTLIITILEYNDQPPRFLPYKNVTISEDQPAGTFVMALKATDEDDAISEYRMIESPRNFFTIGLYTGVVVTTETIIDYEEIEETYFIVQVFDDGVPRLSATAYVHVTIVNVNDNSPIFDRPSYNLNFPENSPGGKSLLRVHATDLDKGHFGQIKYFLTDPFNRFYMNNETGEIFVSPGAVLDREATPSIDILVTAYDSQLDPSVRRFTEVSIFLYLDDVNDNPPKFKVNDYIIRIPETIPINTEIFQVAATDQDLGINAYITFSKVRDSGDPQDFFALNPQTGRIRVSKSLLRQTGTYRFQVMASDAKYNTTANVTVIVFEAANSQPIWVIPPKTNMTIEVLESQYLGMLVFQVSARDDDRGTNGLIDYGFSVGNQTLSATSPEFRINPLTGVIRAERVFDREERDRYVLILVARDRGNPYLETQRSLTVVIIDVNDNVPVFPQSGGGQTIPYRFQISENAPNGSRINAVTATDADLNPKIYYYIIGISEEAPVQQSIVQVQAIDEDAYGNIRYRITQGNTGGALSIDPTNGIITNNILMQNQENFLLDVQADDSAGGVTLSAETAAKVLIFVTQKTKEVKLIIKQPASEVRTFIANYQTELQKFKRNNNNKYFDFICFSDIRDHVLDDGQTTSLWSDVYLSAICANCFNRNYYIYTTDELLRELTQLQNENKDTFDLLYINDMEPALGEQSYIDSTPTLVVMIIIILLFVLIIVFLIIACYCIQVSSRKKKALIHQHHVEEPTFEPVVVEKGLNPVYDNRGYEPEEPHAQYAQVLKRREIEPEQVPEAEPSPRYSDQSATMEVEIKDDSSPERSPPESPRIIDPADEEFVIETQVL
ncbi:hypothetical protein KUTeg_004024 [Tegillarca granosa]|uniref:Cadherin domain-containing protein n=1 Tax=Tegillarca granosa TaxID=220873 RepID=A0ABQ9FNT1_TEGGR|nr:hypothetical protein KUTeg_004024 [Tegillarca granosa]